MMTNLLNGAHVANKLFSTIARLRLLLVMFVALSVSAEVWSADVTINVASDTWTNTGTSNTGSTTKVSKSGVTVSSNKGYKDGTTAIREYSGGNITVSSNDNITKIVFTSTANKGSKYGPDCIALKSGSAGTYTTSSNSNLGTWTGTAKSITFTCSAQFRWKQVVVTTASSHTVTWTINPAAGGTLSAPTGNSITVTPDVAYTYGSPVYTVIPSGKASVVQNDNKFTATPSANCTIQINMVKKQKNTYIDQVHGSEEQIGYGTHNVPMLIDKTPATTGSCEQQHWHFMGWVTEANKENPTDANIIAPNTSVDANEATYYAVWAKGSETNGGNVETTITIPNETLIKSLTNSYGDKSFSYEGYTFNLNACVQSSYCQMRDNTTISFIQIPTLPGPITKISCTDCKNASNSAYTGTLHFKSSKTRGNSDTNDIAKITYNSVNSFEWEIDNDTHKTGYLLTSAGLRLKDLSITYITSGKTTTYSDYITQCIKETSVTLDPNGGTFASTPDGWTLDGDKLTKEVDGSVILPTPIHDGCYDFAGWYDAANGGNKISDASKYEPEEDIELFAHWTESTTSFIAMIDDENIPTVEGFAIEIGLNKDGTGKDTDGVETTCGNKVYLFRTLVQGYKEVQWTVTIDGTQETIAVQNDGDVPYFVMPKADVLVSAELIECDEMNAPVVTATSTNNSITLSWDPIIGAKEYNVFIFYNDGNSHQQDDADVVIDGTSYTFTNLDAEHTYTYMVQAQAEIGTCFTAAMGEIATAPTTCKVTYDANGGEGTITDATEYTNGAKVTVKGNFGIFTKDGYAFTGWNTKADGSGDSYKHNDQFAITTNTTLYAQWCEAYWKLVTNASELENDTRIVIAAKDYNFALSTTQNDANRGQAAITKKYNTITFGADVQTLSAVGPVNKNFALYSPGPLSIGYLYAASKSANQLKTKDGFDLNGNSDWSIAISQGTATATILAQGTNTNNQLKYNAGSDLFSCYGEDNSQKDVVIYKEVCVQDQYNVTSNLTNSTAETNPTTVASNATSLTLNYSANTGYLLPETITVKMGGVELLSGTDYNWNKETGVLTITVTGFYGDIDVKIVAEEDPCYGFAMSAVNATSTTTYITLDWIAVEGATGYNVRLGDGAFTAANGLTHTFTDLNPKTTYTWEVQAVKGTCQASQTGSITTQKETFTVSWVVNGNTDSPYATESVVDGNSITLSPSDPEDNVLGYCASKFMGWSETKLGSTAGKSAPDDLCSAAEIKAKYTSLTEDKTFYAVFATPERATAEVSLSFVDKAQRTSYSTEQQIWEQNGVTLTNNKLSASPLGDYADPARFYKNSSITIEYAYPMYKIVFDCNGDESITNLKSVINDASVAGDIVTVEFNEPVESYTIILTTGQVRLDNLTIIPIAYSNYVTQCDALPTPTYAGPSIDKNELKVKCGDRSSMNSAAVISFDPTTNYDLSLPITLTASEGFLLSTNKTKNDAYTSSVTVNPVKSDANGNKGKITQNVYVRAEASADTKDDYTGTITIEGAQVETKTIDVTAIVTCEPHTMTFYSYNTKTKAKYYVGDAVEEPEAPAQPCEGYVFDGWAESIVEEGATTYSKVTFPYEMPNRNTILYAVYQIQEESNYTKVTEDLADYSGEYLIVYEDGKVAFNGGLAELDAANNNIGITIKGNTIESNATANAAKFTIAKVDGGYSIKSASGYYIGAKTGNNNGLATSPTTAYPTTISIADLVQDTKYLRYNSDSNQKRFRYYKSDSYAGQKAIALYKKDISYTSYPDCTPPVEPETPQALPSAFSVSATEKVQFSAGNLQYHTRDEVWRFAPEQYDVLGEQNIELGNPKFKDWVDMFGWSADGKFGVNPSNDQSNYNGEFVDWGKVFSDAKYGISADEWYTLSMNEWYYLLYTRTNASSLKQVATVGDMIGVLLFPDDWVMPKGIEVTKQTDVDGVEYYPYTIDQWKQLEAAGAVFLPAAGRRTGGWGNKTVSPHIEDKENPDNFDSEGYYRWQDNTNYYGYYWTSTKDDSDGRSYFLITCKMGADGETGNPSLPSLWDEQGRYGQSVRLARKLMPLHVVEWKENSVVVMYNGDPAQTATVTINNEQKGSAPLSEVAKDIAVYELPATGLASSPNQPLEIAIGTAKVTMTIPYIATTTTTNVPNNSDLVVLKDATFTATNEQLLRNITVYGGGMLVVDEGATLSTNSLTLRAGGVTADGNYDYVYPEFVLNGTWTNTSGKINLDYLTTKEQYYTFVAPFAVQTKDIHYPVDIYGNNVAATNKGSFEFEYYDGEARATGATGWKTVEEGTDGATLNPGQGYTFLGMPKKINGTRQKYGIHRIPMAVTATDAMTHETTDQTAPLSVYLCDKNNNSGWNLIGNPYMSTIGGLTNENIQVGKLVHTTDANGNWTGGWHWDEETVKSGQRFLVIPSNDGQSYEAVQASNATLPAFKNFFVQIGKENANALSIPRTKPSAQLLAPARRTEEVVKDVEVAIVLEQDEAHTDQMDFLINNIYTEDFERDADFTKMMNATNLNLYGVHPYDNLSFVAIDNNTARGSVAIGYQVPQAGEYTLRMSDKPYVMFDKIEALYVTDHEMSPEVTTDIMSEPYRFTVAKAETNHTRFTVSVIQKVEEDDSGGDVGTGVDNTTNNNTPCKFIYQDKMYILRNGVIYDAMGKQVQTINK